MKSLILAFLFLIPVVFQSLQASEPATQIPKSAIVMLAEDCTYWITKSSHKRHNKECRYYQNSKGYCTEDRSEGVACKVCGG